MEKKIEKMTKAELLDLLNHKEEVLQEKIKQIEDLEEKKIQAEESLEDEINSRNYAKEKAAILKKKLEEEEQINEVLHETIEVKDAKIRNYRKARIVYLVAIVVLLGVVGCILNHVY